MGPSTPAPRASIIIVTYGQRAMTEQCLRSLERCLGEGLGREWQLVLVDNNSRDDTPELLRAWADRATVRLLQENRNFAGGCNLGAAVSRGEVLIFLNNDTEITPGALETLFDQALEPGVSVAGCRLLFPNGTLQHAGVAFVRSPHFGGVAMPQHIFHHQDQDLPAAHGCYDLDCVTAACMAVRAESFRAVGGFDETYRNGLEDVDLCLRLRVAGGRIVYRGDVAIVHHEGASRGSGAQLWATPERLEAMRSNDLHFIRTWGSMLDQDDKLAATAWDASLEDGPPPRGGGLAEVAVVGQPGGIGPAADEARALLAAFAGSGLATAAVDSPAPRVAPRLADGQAILLDQARRRIPAPGLPVVIVPSGAHDPHEVDGGSIVRIAQVATAVRLEDAAEVWAASPRLADALTRAGLPRERVAVVFPAVPPAAVGPGDGGVLAVLPVHDPGLARLVVEALRGLPRSTALRVVPTIATLQLEAQVREALPGAQLLAPCSDEARFAELAATADAVVAIDRADRFDRRALVAASVGAAPITANRAGPAAAVLGEAVLADPAMIGEALKARLTQGGDRSETARRVADACRPELVADRLVALPVA